MTTTTSSKRRNTSTPTVKKDALAVLLGRKNLNEYLFENGDVTLEDPIERHAAWVFKNIYSIPCLYGTADECESVARCYHGIQHASRVAMYIPVLANLYRRYGDVDALNLDPDDLKLIQIAALFHDTARENEDRDEWDHESGLFLYHYLTKTLKVEHEKAKLLAEAIANKDAEKQGYRELVSKDGELVWNETTIRPKNIYQKLIHDADCLDIIRARNHFEAQYLDFYQQVAQDNPRAFDEMAQLITEVRGIIEVQGDGRFRIIPAVKKFYEQADAYEKTVATINPDYQTIIPYLYGNGSLLAEEALQGPLLNPPVFVPEAELTEENMRAALYEGRILVRAIAAPAAYNKRDKGIPRAENAAQVSDLDELEVPKINSMQEIEIQRETLVTKEIRKIHRQKGEPTRAGYQNKEGNPYRSTSLIGWGCSVYAGQGFLIVNPDVRNMNKIAQSDCDSGRRKKNQFQEQNTEISHEEKEKQLNELRHTQKMGGKSRYRGDNYVDTHNEIIYHVTHVDAIYFTRDPNIYNVIATDSQLPPHLYAAELQALFIQEEYKKANGILLPLYEYSGMKNFLKLTYPLSDDEIVTKWVEMCGDYIKNSLGEEESPRFIKSQSLEEIKVLSMYGVPFDRLGNINQPADLNLPAPLRCRIDAAIAERREELLAAHREKIRLELRNDCKSSSFYRAFLAITHFPILAMELKNDIKAMLHEECDILEKIVHGEIKTPLFYFSFSKGNYSPERLECIFRDDEILRMYYLAKITADTSSMARIKTAMKCKIQMEFEKTKNDENISRLDQINRLEKIIDIAHKFDLFESFEQEITEHIKQYFTGINAQGLCWIINLLDEINMTDELYILVEAARASVKAKYALAGSCNHLDSVYLPSIEKWFNPERRCFPLRLAMHTFDANLRRNMAQQVREEPELKQVSTWQEIHKECHSSLSSSAAFFRTRPVEMMPTQEAIRDTLICAN